ncbi:MULTISPECIES: class I SAM-dependent methyltransferase [Micromonospora]|uniref:Class I SAM-dependent methyltransferase n=1 Tax=Micromonospora solifontis TaxID=2487138 RepID=A0ABX9WJ82_9ACTN|nr:MULTISPECIES: methyltransferase domain-containing protein [Micromonospora]NES15446.1 class I SAM-dependent methyltransferase [Micromonospora sp. PPF5-17B]NES35808.1 class I SAM-dependent methyltransferase [Micromonospora solifontis]NES55644.1 class I SAM-dependent methyltransferase [Micromonospora sp. PPF5-6]RNM00286.1 class I SAM-dependent methyltransferase [Micromonospora solifontis]
MAMMAYDDPAAAAFVATRHLPAEGLASWRAAVARHLPVRPGARVLDLGAGTGAWAAAFRSWYDVRVVAVEPAAAMRARSAYPGMVAGRAEALPLAAATVDGAWLSTVVHHLPDLPSVAAELRRVLRPGAPVLIRSVFAGRSAGVTLFRWFPEAVRVLDGYPSVAEVCAAFEPAGFAPVALTPVPQVSARSLRDAADGLRRAAHTPLTLLDDADYDRGVRRLRAAARRTPGVPVVDVLDLLVLR